MKHLVLAGGGHANMLALRAMAGGGKITLVSESAETPYSGMLPGYIAGHYRREQCFINLPRAAAAFGAAFAEARVTGLRGSALILANGQRLGFDVLSLNTGALPPCPDAAGGAACAVKPIDDFMRWLDAQTPGAFQRLAVIGGGAGGVETILALAHRWRDKPPALTLIADALLPGQTAAMRRYVRRQLQARGIRLVIARAAAYDGAHVHLSSGERLPACRAVYATAVAAAGWFADTGLPLDDSGFIRVNQYLQSAAAENIFISGDAAAHAAPLPKAGVMAVRQGRLLAHNLPVAAGWRSGRLKAFAARRQALYIIGSGDGLSAVASRSGFTAAGRWVWRWKQYLDFKFMNKFNRAVR